MAAVDAEGLELLQLVAEAEAESEPAVRITSTTAASSATRNGSCSGNNSTAVPMVTRVVRAATAAAIGSTDGKYSSSMKWCSVSHTVSNPSASTASMCSSVSAYSSARPIPDDGGLRMSYSTPSSMAPPLDRVLVYYAWPLGDAVTRDEAAGGGGSAGSDGSGGS